MWKKRERRNNMPKDQPIIEYEVTIDVSEKEKEDSIFGHKVASVTGKGSTTYEAFENAVEKINLVTLSSAVPPDAERIEKST